MQRRSLSVFDDEKTVPFLQLYCDALQKIMDDFHAEIAKTPASVVGLGECDEDDDDDDGDGDPATI